MSKHRDQELGTPDQDQVWTYFPHLLNALVSKEKKPKRKSRARAEENFSKLLTWKMLAPERAVGAYLRAALGQGEPHMRTGFYHPNQAGETRNLQLQNNL